MWAFRARFVRCGVALFLKIKQRIGIKIGAENTEPSFGDARSVEARSIRHAARDSPSAAG